MVNESKSFIEIISVNGKHYEFIIPSGTKYIRTVLQYRNQSTNISVNDLNNIVFTLNEYITNTTTVVQAKNHTLTAIWEENTNS